mmetsp:Transcript_14644/g.55362  ORF Transcript_14644/g.55362 Transcript_14644/m.55362 type:complete len:816 (-) Transcript_14644:342-2789(-)|eukprot:scaffold48_cov311-Pinguiococcus_pyrenoidosus.AAC.113
MLGTSKGDEAPSHGNELLSGPSGSTDLSSEREGPVLATNDSEDGAVRYSQGLLIPAPPPPMPEQSDYESRSEFSMPPPQRVQSGRYGADGMPAPPASHYGNTTSSVANSEYSDHGGKTVTTGVTDDGDYLDDAVDEAGGIPMTPSDLDSLRTEEDLAREVRDLKILCCSANIGNAPPDDLNKWLPPHGHGAHIIAVGVQEATWGGRGKKKKAAQKEKEERDTFDEDEDDDDYVPASAPRFQRFDSADPDVALKAGEASDGATPNASDTISTRFIAHLNACKAVQTTRVLSGKGPDFNCTGVGARTFTTFDYAHGHPYVLLATRRAGQMRLYIFARPAVVEMTREVETHSENTGIGGVLANKGGQMVKLRIRGTTLCFVSSHLAAHEGPVYAKARNANVMEILNGCRLGQTSLDATNQFTHVFWMGDLNYRVSSQISENAREYIEKFANQSVSRIPLEGISTDAEDDDPDEEGKIDEPKELAATGAAAKKAAKAAFREYVLDLINSGDFETLYRMDELQQFIRSNVIFCGFDTPVPDFKPTFKVKREQGVSYNEKRIPSYTDRILYKSLPGMQKNLNLQFFKSHEEFSSSDHKPISALFNVRTIPPSAIHKAKKHAPNMAILVLQGLMCRDLPEMDLSVLGGLADPYIKFYSSPPQLIRMQRKGGAKQKRPRTETRQRTLSPKWDDVRLKLNMDYGASLEGCHLMLHVMDYDLSNPDDPIGTGVLNLSEVADTYEEGLEFDIPIHLNGEFRGSVCGRAHLTCRNIEAGLPVNAVQRRVSHMPTVKSLMNRSQAEQLIHEDSAYQVHRGENGKCIIT